MVVLTSVVCSCGRNNADKENGNNWIDVSYSENYFEEVLIKYDEGHFPWRNDKYEVAKEFLVSDKIDDRILGDVNMIEEKNDSYVFETEDNKKIEVHIMKPFSDAEIYFVDKYRYLFVAES